MNVRGLIAEAYYLSTVLARDFEQPSGQKAFDGLSKLNDILAEKAYAWREIPFRTRLTLPCVVGQEEYVLTNLAELESLVYFLGNIRIPLLPDTFNRYFTSPRVENVQSLPYHYYAEKERGQIRVYLYFLPSNNYQLLAIGRTYFPDLALDDELDLIMDKAYQAYLKYELAAYLADFNSAELPARVEVERRRLFKLILDRNPVDTTPRRRLALGGDGDMNWGVTNIGNGWTR